MVKRRSDILGDRTEEMALEVLREKGFTDIKRAETVGDYVARKDEETYRIEVKRSGGRRKRFKVKLRSTQQDRLLDTARRNQEIPVFMVYFPKHHRWVFKDAYASKVEPTDKSLF